MLISLNLLKKYIDLPLTTTPAEIAAKLSTSTVEVEEAFSVGKDLANMVIGKVVKLEKHPNADKLRIAMTDIGKVELAKIICGGVNLYEGMLTAVAEPGAYVRWHGEGKPVRLEKTKIRGEESEGIICAANEIGLSDRFSAGEMEIIDLTAMDLKVGEPLAKALGLEDTVIDIDNKSITNRPDLWSHYGLARELAAIYQLGLKPFQLDDKLEIKKSKGKANGELKVSIKDYSLCPRYLGAVVSGIKVKESPLWLKNILTSVGLRPINNIVDITNYVMIEVGQPLHAFDRSKVDNIVVRLANQGEKIITLDKIERELSPEMLVIADSKKPIAVAGVMGGANSQVDETTKAIIIEAANFDAISIRKTTQRLGLRTDASMRFEKSLDPNLAETAIRRVCALIKEIIPGAEIDGIIVADGNLLNKKNEIEAGLLAIRNKIGEEIKTEEITDILRRLGFEIKHKKDSLAITVPSWRSTGDIVCEEDIAEEVARIYGYDKIKADFPEIKMKPLTSESGRLIINKIKDKLAFGFGMQEVLNYSFWPGKTVSDFEIDKEPELIGLLNPPSEDQKYLRMSLVPGLLKNIADNGRFYDEFKFYEIGRVFFVRKGKYRVKKQSKEHLPEQPYYLAGAVVLAKDGESFSEAKGDLEELARYFKFGFLPWSAGKNPFIEFINKIADKEKRLAIIYGKEKIGWLGEINQMAMNYFDIKNKRVAIFEIDLTQILEVKVKEEKTYEPLPKYPAVERDIAIELGWKVKWTAIEEEVVKLEPEIVRSAEFLSEYDLGAKKSLAFRVKYQAADRTLKDEEAVAIESEIVKILGEKFGAKRR
ncbi:phenylalanine--tRNA ligase subunit beta [Candidatus Kuenenbacteria bacterium RIFCSPLOWO2_02_FULL_42_16]|uniref:Phenylalanine--tRNA ligase beta subunit n=1 Tax=Candidatus Kuenenbacteria bacterium RIFCSPLOWO2_02_FULL_42_16 TaxID=1798564 RepID=A0A1F6FWG5_9BACT|nr:MAG: phenylalanine--tRNA ligase subunit beta [Candidatus Kuenenbacteria bacterium RIFCSPLOWO2_02_FULL_42_16]